jgi:exosortase A
MRSESDIALQRQEQGATVSAAALIALAAIAGVLALFGSTALSMVQTWTRNATFMHGFVIAPVAAWLVWERRAALRNVSAKPDWLGLVVVAAASALWLLSSIVLVNAGMQLALVLLVQAAVLTVAGRDVVRAIAFPLVFLLFAVPMGEFLLPTLMDWTADFTVAALRLTGIPVFREGNDFVIPSGSWSVVEACSGIRYLIASFMGGTLFAYLAYRSPWRRAAFIAASIAVPVVANWLRAYLIVMIGHLSGNELAAGVDHFIYGWVFFGVVVFLMFWVGSWWKEPGEFTARRVASHGQQAHAVPGTVHASSYMLAGLAVLCVAALGPLLASSLAASVDPRAPALAPVAATSDWRNAEAPLASWRPRFVGYRTELQQSFTNDAAQVGLYIAYYRDERSHGALVSSVNVLAATSDDRWREVAARPEPIEWQSSTLRARYAELAGSEGRLAVLHWYWIDGHVTASDVTAKLLQAWAKLRGRGDDAAAIVVFARQAEGARTVQTLQRFAREMSNPIAQALAAAQRAAAP